MLFSLDIETTGLSWFNDKLLCIGVYNDRLGYKFFGSLAEFTKWNKSTYRYVCHNGRFDINFLRHLGCDLRHQFSYDTRSVATTLVPIPQIAAGQRHIYALENLHIQLLNGTSYKLDRTTLEHVSQEELKAYNQKDCEITWKLFDYLTQRLAPKDWDFVESWVMPVTKLCSDMEYNGVYVDQKKLTELTHINQDSLSKIKLELDELTIEPRRKWHELEREKLNQTYSELLNKALVKAKDKEKARTRYQALKQTAQEKIEPFNFNSPLQLKWLLRDYYGLDLFNKRSKKETTDEAMLASHAERSAICRKLLEFRTVDKMVSTCIPAVADNLQPDGRVHPGFNIGGTRTGRLSSSGPNFQNLPTGPLRSCIIPSPGHVFYIADYAQIEVRILAELAKEKELLNDFKKGIDPYSIIAHRLFRLDCEVSHIKELFPNERAAAKTAGLSILYGTGPAKLQETLKKLLDLDLTLNECRAYIESYREDFQAIKKFKTRCERELSNQKKVYNLLGRPNYIESNDDLYMTAMNTLSQGSASDLVAKVLSIIYERYPFVRPVMLVHDEMVMEIPEDKVNDALVSDIQDIATRQMEQLLNLEAPLIIEYSLSKEWEKP